MPESDTHKDPLEFPYDLYQRYELVRKIIKSLDGLTGKMLPVLEVGGDPGVLAAFLTDETPVVVNTPPQAGDDIITANGRALPFKDNSFRGAVAIDVLEHVPEDQRQEMIQEVDRVCADWMVIGGPFQHELVEEAETILADFYRQLNGTSHRFLEEHRAIGLPDREKTVEYLQSMGYNTIEIPNGLLCRWMLMLGITFFLQKHPNDSDIINNVFRFANQHLTATDNREPAYRHIIICVRGDIPENICKQLQCLETPLSTVPEEDFTASWEGATAGLQTLIADKIRQRDEQISEMEGQIKILEEFRDNVQRSAAYRVYRFWKNLWKRR